MAVPALYLARQIARKPRYQAVSFGSEKPHDAVPKARSDGASEKGKSGAHGAPMEGAPSDKRHVRTGM